MNTLAIPDLELFHNRKNSFHKQYLYHDHGHFLQNCEEAKYISDRKNKDAKRFASSDGRYKQIADEYLNQRPKLSSFCINPTPYINYISHNSWIPPQKDLWNKTAEHQYYFISKGNFDKQNPNLWSEKNKKKQTKLLKDPYLHPNFREGKGFNNLQKSSKEERDAFHTVQEQISNNSMSKIMEKLKTHQSDEMEDHSKSNHAKRLSLHEAQIQTQTTPQASDMFHKKQQKIKSRSQVEVILQQQKQLIESLRMETQRQNQFRNEIQDLQSTKGQYIEKSRQILAKLNQLSEDRKEFSLIFKAFTDKKKTNAFRNLEI